MFGLVGNSYATITLNVAPQAKDENIVDDKKFEKQTFNHAILHTDDAIELFNGSKPSPPGEVFYIKINQEILPAFSSLNLKHRGKIHFDGNHRKHFNVAFNDKMDIDLFGATEEVPPLTKLKLDIQFSQKPDPVAFTVEELEREAKLAFFEKGTLSPYITPGASSHLKIKGKYYLVQVKSLEPFESLGRVQVDTKIVFESADPRILIQDPQKSKPLFKSNFDLTQMGIGGMGPQFERMFSRVFLPHALSAEARKKRDMTPVRGMILYGPPGTGKTLLARQIAKVINSKEPKIVNGPELLNKYVGESEANVRELFAEAEAEYKAKGDYSDLHVIIFDEIDSLCKKRGSSQNGTAAADNVVNQLLTKLDGVEPLNNILVIGMTNRLDLLDEALLREGRFGVQIEVGLPDLQGRQEILRIHTASLRESNLLGQDVDLDVIAERTKNFTGAELKGLIEEANCYALVEKTDPSAGRYFPESAEAVPVYQEHFCRALEKVKPAFGQSGIDLPKNLISYPSYDSLSREGNEAVNQFKKNKLLHQSVLFTGAKGSGKSVLASQLCVQFDFCRVISPMDLAGNIDSKQAEILKEAYKDAIRVGGALLLDNVDVMMNYSKGGGYSRSVSQVINAMLSPQPKQDKKVLILATVKQDPIEFEEYTGLQFDKVYRVPNLTESDWQVLGSETHTLMPKTIREFLSFGP
jgi:SpoVK/Ycf46/Vps4 family AAA+-type ATPase